MDPAEPPVPARQLLTFHTLCFSTMDSLPQITLNPGNSLPSGVFWDELQPYKPQLAPSSAGICFHLQVEQGCCGRARSCCPGIPPRENPTPASQRSPLEPPICRDRVPRTSAPTTILGGSARDWILGYPSATKGCGSGAAFPWQQEDLGLSWGKHLSLQDGFSRSERQDLEAARQPGREIWNPGAGEEEGRKTWIQSRPPHLQEGRSVEMNFPK